MTIKSTLERIAIALERLYLEAAPKTETTDAPKATRQRKTAVATTTEPATVADSAAPVDTKTSTDKETDDLFGDEPVKEEKAKKVTMDDVRAKLVEVQTKFKHKDHALACLKKVSGGLVLSGLKEEDFGKLVDLCTSALTKDTPPKF